MSSIGRMMFSIKSQSAAQCPNNMFATAAQCPRAFTTQCSSIFTTGM